VILVLAIIGGRALFVLTHWSDYAPDPLGVLRLWEGGLTLYGGYILAVAGGILYVRRRGLPLWKMADAAAPSMAIGIGIGRLGCFLNGCCFGLPAHLPWAVTFPAASYSAYVFPGVPLHPSQLYLALAGFALFFLLLRLDRAPHFDGWLFWTGIGLDAVFRFLIDFTRYYDQSSFLGKWGGLSFNVNQVLSGFLILTSLIMLRILSRSRRAATLPAGGASQPDSPPAAGAGAVEHRPST
jgi:phosphatidylglycerol:prolipoprotein diacylglycerol transferase